MSGELLTILGNEILKSSPNWLQKQIKNVFISNCDFHYPGPAHSHIVSLKLSWLNSLESLLHDTLDFRLEMGKAQKIKVSKKSHPVAPSEPLADQLTSDQFAAASGRTKERRRLDEDEDFVESRLSKNIISQARLQVGHLFCQHGWITCFYGGER